MALPRHIPRCRHPLPGQLCLNFEAEPEKPGVEALAPVVWEDADVAAIRKGLLRKSLSYLKQERTSFLEVGEILYWVSEPMETERARPLSFQDCAIFAGYNPVPLAWGICRSTYRLHARLKARAIHELRESTRKKLVGATIAPADPLLLWDAPLFMQRTAKARAQKHERILRLCRKAMQRLPVEAYDAFELATIQ